MQPAITISENEEKEFTAFLQTCIREFNNRTSPQHRAIREPGAVQPLHVILKDETGQVIGGLSGSLYWGWFDIDNFFIPAELRGNGIGTSLLQTAEALAKQKGAAQCFLFTFEFQARTFYEGHGYRIVGKLEGYPPGSTYYWMRKDL